jgi:hypothetical protein
MHKHISGHLQRAAAEAGAAAGSKLGTVVGTVNTSISLCMYAFRSQGFFPFVSNMYRLTRTDDALASVAEHVLNSTTQAHCLSWVIL